MLIRDFEEWVMPCGHEVLGYPGETSHWCRRLLLMERQLPWWRERIEWEAGR